MSSENKSFRVRDLSKQSSLDRTIEEIKQSFMIGAQKRNGMVMVIVEYSIYDMTFSFPVNGYQNYLNQFAETDHRKALEQVWTELAPQLEDIKRSSLDRYNERIREAEMGENEIIFELD